MTSSPAGPSSPRRPSTLLEAVSTQLRRDPGQPCLTFYDAATGERIELSWVTFDNWTSKVANLFTDELDAQPGDRITVTLPTHWLGPAVLFGAWAAGLVPAYGDAGGDAVVHVVGPDPLAADAVRRHRPRLFAATSRRALHRAAAVGMAGLRCRGSAAAGPVADARAGHLGDAGDHLVIRRRVTRRPCAGGSGAGGESSVWHRVVGSRQTSTQPTTRRWRPPWPRPGRSVAQWSWS